MIEEKRRELHSLRQCLSNDGGQCSNQAPQLIEDPAPAPAPAAEEYESNILKPYSLEFYEQGLMQMEMNELLQPPPTSATAPPAAPAASEQDSLIELNFDDEELELEVDQYLNFDDLDL